MANLGFATEWDAFTDTTPFGTRNFRNLIATFDESAPRRLVLACHYDSKIIPGQVMIAATDSAVPCAMMLDIAQTLAPYMYKRVNQNIGLQLIFFDGEEAFRDWTATDSLYGSRHLAQKWEQKWYPSSSSLNNFELSKEIDRIVSIPSQLKKNFCFLGCVCTTRSSWSCQSINRKHNRVWSHWIVRSAGRHRIESPIIWMSPINQ